MREHGTERSDGTLILGDQWEDWNGEVGSHEAEIKEGPTSFVLFFLLELFLYWCTAAAFVYLVYPRLADIHEVLADASVAAAGAFIAGSALWAFFILLSAALRRAFLVGSLTQHILPLFLNSLLLRLARVFGYTRDRIGNSFIKLNNMISRASRRKFENTVVLLPRCLRKDVRAKILELAERYGVSAHTVGGGEQARKVMSKEKPDSLVAVACERDLTSGLKDTILSIVVIGVPNIRREGPCRNTEIDIPAFEDALQFFKGEK